MAFLGQPPHHDKSARHFRARIEAFQSLAAPFPGERKAAREGERVYHRRDAA
jgi:hypothetical protein